MPADRTLKSRPPRVVPYEQVVSLEAPPAPPPPARASSMAQLVSQTQQPPQPPHPFSHPAYQHYPPPVYPYPPPPPQHYPSYHYTQHPQVYAHHPPNGHHYPPAPPPARPPPPPHPSAPTAETPAAPAQQEGDSTLNPVHRWQGRALSEDEDTRLARVALRWVLVRDPAVSQTLYWNDVAKSFERITGRHYATCKRRIGLLEDQWRAKFAARSAEGGLPRNNNTDLARAMRAWIAFRDDEERAKKEKEEDVKALDVRRRRLHELETERLVTDVCRFETRVVGEDEEIGPQGVETTERPPANGDRTNPIPLEEESTAASRDRQLDLCAPTDLERTNVEKQSETSDQIAPIVELLRKRQREEREEADIRREEQILLNKRLAMMEEQVQMLTKLITQREQNTLPTSPPRQPVESVDKDVEVSAAPGREAVRTSEGVSAINVIDDTPTPTSNAAHASAEASVKPGATAGPEDTGGSPHTTNGAEEVPADVSMGESAEMSAESGAAAGSVDTGETTHAVNGAGDVPADVFMGDNEGPFDDSSAEPEAKKLLGMAASQNDNSQKPQTVVAKSPDIESGEASGTATEAVKDAQAVQA